MSNLNLWKLSENWPLRVSKRFPNHNEYDYSLHVSDYNRSGKDIWIHVVSSTSCYWIEEDCPNNAEFISDIEKDSRFMSLSFVELQVTFNPIFFILGSIYVLKFTTPKLYELVEFRPTCLKFKCLSTGQTLDFTLDDLAINTYSFREALSVYKRTPQPVNTILVQWLNRIQKAVPVNILMEDNIPNKNLIKSQKVYSYKQKLCFVKDINLHEHVITLGYINNSLDEDVPFSDVSKIHPILSYNPKKSTTQKLQSIHLQKTPMFKTFGNCLYVLYTSSPGILQECTFSKGIFSCYELINPSGSKITPFNISDCYTYELFSVPEMSEEHTYFLAHGIWKFLRKDDE